LRSISQLPGSPCVVEPDIACAKHVKFPDPDSALLLQLRGEDRTSVTELQNLLKQTAEVYRSLVQHAKAASVPVPPEAQLGTGVKRGPDQLEYDEFAAANATDWDDFQDEGVGCLSQAVLEPLIKVVECWQAHELELYRSRI